MSKTLRATDNEFLADHMIGDNEVLPTVCAMAWMADAAESAFGGYHYVGLENYKLFKGIVFDGSEASDYQIDLAVLEEPKGSPDQLYVDSKISSLNANGKAIFHYGAKILLNSSSSKQLLPKANLSEDLSNHTEITEAARQIYSNGTLFHGESLQGIRDIIHCDDKGLLLACKVPAVAQSKQGDFPILSQNIFANDLVYQAMLVWVRKQLSLGSLPSSTKQWITYAQVKAEQLFYLQLTVKEQNNTKLIADISLISTENELLAEIKSAEVTVSESLNDLFKPSSNLDTAKISGL